MNPSFRPTPLLLVAASAVAGHFLVVTPLVDAARGVLRGPVRCEAVECGPDGAPDVMETMMETVPKLHRATVAPPRWASRFRASSLDSREIWRGEFDGVVQPSGPQITVRLHRATVALSTEAPAGVLRGLRVDLAEPTPDGSWRIAREGVPLEVGMRLAPGEAVRLPRMELSLPRVPDAELRGRWLVATMLVDTPGGFSTLAHAHMDAGMAQGLAETARRAEAWAPEVQVR
jgi:hypothetical protein